RNNSLPVMVSHRMASSPTAVSTRWLSLRKAAELQEISYLVEGRGQHNHPDPGLAHPRPEYLHLRAAWAQRPLQPFQPRSKRHNPRRRTLGESRATRRWRRWQWRFKAGRFIADRVEWMFSRVLQVKRFRPGALLFVRQACCVSGRWSFAGRDDRNPKAR